MESLIRRTLHPLQNATIDHVDEVSPNTFFVTLGCIRCRAVVITFVDAAEDLSVLRDPVCLCCRSTGRRERRQSPVPRGVRRVHAA